MNYTQPMCMGYMCMCADMVAHLTVFKDISRVHAVKARADLLVGSGCLAEQMGRLRPCLLLQLQTELSLWQL